MAFVELNGMIIIPFHIMGKNVGFITGFNPFFGKKNAEYRQDAKNPLSNIYNVAKNNIYVVYIWHQKVIHCLGQLDGDQI